MVKHGLNWTSKTWTGPLVKHGLAQKPRLVKHGLDSFSKTWTGLKSARLVKHGLDSFSKTWTQNRKLWVERGAGIFDRHIIN